MGETFLHKIWIRSLPKMRPYSVLVTLLADWKEKWWVMVMDVGLDPELTKLVYVFGSGYCPNREVI